MTITSNPLGPCQHCINTRMATDPASGVSIVHCEHHRAGAAFIPSTGRWSIISPISREEYERHLDSTYAALDDLARRTAS